ncbi:MAG: alpha/beta hydrolase [Acidobacteria bacterium]|nr:alpha/beta hydrolase [Acidobacteriota bacterium]
MSRILQQRAAALSRVHRRSLVIGVLVAATVPAFGQPSVGPDTSPHRVQRVEVESSVSLEVLDWGGSGRPVVLLAGGGNSAHVFDDFAPPLTRRYHVYGVTRRGYGVSDKPTTGYSVDRLADDVASVVDALKIERSVVIGHSVAGDELSSIGSRHSERISGLIYLDAAYDRTDPAWNAINSKLPPTAPALADRENVRAFQGWMTRALRFTLPLSEIYNEFELTPAGGIGRSRIPPAVSREILAGMKKPDYSRLLVPALALYAQYRSIQEAPGYKDNDPAARTALEEYLSLVAARQVVEIESFKAAAVNARVARVPGGHYFFLANPQDTNKEIDAFIADLP